MSASQPPNRPGRVLIATHRTNEAWWRAAGAAMGYEAVARVSDMRGEGEYNIVDDFYAAYAAHYAAPGQASPHLTPDQIEDVIARCRLLRWLPVRKATAMALAAADAYTKVLDEFRPTTIICWTIDRYNLDILERIAAARDIPFYELTVSAVPGMSMILQRGQIVTRAEVPPPEQVERIAHEIADPLFTPTYVRGQQRYTRTRWLKTFTAFRLRGWYWKAVSILKRDPLNLHYMDAQGFLGHKPRLSDIRAVRMVDEDWRERLAAFPIEKRLFVGLQLFPEASIDYWIADTSLHDQEAVAAAVAEAFSAAGYLVMVKDHPLQFGFRQARMIERLRAIANVVIVPSEISGNEALDLCGVNFTCTGTLGMQAALLGKASIVTPCYFTTPGDFVEVKSRDDIAALPERVAAFDLGGLEARQRRIVANLLKGSFESEFFSFRGFDPDAPGVETVELGRAMAEFIDALPSPPQFGKATAA